jgi:site-specific DNA recombinase
VTALRPVPDTPPRVIGYVRVSMAREAMISPAIQRTSVTDWAARTGRTIVGWVEDLDQTGRNFRRRITEAIAEVEAGNADEIAVWKFSRFGRNRLGWAVNLDRVESVGGELQSATEEVDARSAAGRFQRGILAEVAAFESDRIGEVWKEVHANRRDRGLPAQGGNRFGYTRNGNAYTPDGNAGVLAGMYADYLAGAGFTAIAGRLNRAGVRTLSGGPWTRDRVCRVLDSGFAAGMLVSGKGARAVWVGGAHPPLIDEGTWRSYVKARTARRGAAPNTTAPRYVLSGLIRCGDCGAPMHATRLGSGRPGYGYLCSRWAASRQGRCVTVTRAKAEAAVMGWLAGLAGQVNERAEVRQAQHADRLIARADAAHLARQVTALDQRLIRLTHQLAEDLVPPAAYRQVRDDITAEKAALTARLVEVEARSAAPDAPRVAADLLARWDGLGLQERRAVLASLIGRVVAHRAETVTVTVTPRWEL